MKIGIESETVEFKESTGEMHAAIETICPADDCKYEWKTDLYNGKIIDHN